MVWGQKILFEGGFYRGLEVFSFQMRQGSFKVLGFGMCFLHFGPEGLLGGSWNSQSVGISGFRMSGSGLGFRV